MERGVTAAGERRAHLLEGVMCSTGPLLDGPAKAATFALILFSKDRFVLARSLCLYVYNLYTYGAWPSFSTSPKKLEMASPAVLPVRVALLCFTSALPVSSSGRHPTF